MKMQLRKLVTCMAPALGLTFAASAIDARAQVNPMAPPTASSPTTPASPNAAPAPFTPGSTLPSTASSQAQTKAMIGRSVVDNSGKAWGTISNVTVDNTGEQAMITLDGAEGTKTVTVPLAAAVAGQSASGITLSTSDLVGNGANGTSTNGSSSVNGSSSLNGSTTTNGTSGLSGTTSGSSTMETTATPSTTSADKPMSDKPAKKPKIDR